MKERSDNLGVDDDAENDNGTKKRLCIFLKKFLGLCSWIWVCVLVVLVQGTLRSQFIRFLVFNFFYLVKINKLIFLI